jgi:hypothetical protein
LLTAHVGEIFAADKNFKIMIPHRALKCVAGHLSGQQPVVRLDKDHMYIG